MRSAPGIEAVIWDMDGVIIDSEPFWQQAEIEVFGDLGLALDPDDCRQTMGMRIDEVVAFRRPEAGWGEVSDQQVSRRITDRVIELIEQHGSHRAGLHHALDFFSARGLRQALASSSYPPVIHAVLRVLNLGGRFEVVHSAQHEVLGKPHPAVYLNTAALLGVEPTRCLAVEDSTNGVIAAKAARMRCIALPDHAVRLDGRFAAADLLLQSLEQIGDDMWAHLGTSRPS